MFRRKGWRSYSQPRYSGALMNVYATAGHAQDLKADVEGNKEYQLWQEYDRTDIYAMYLEEIMEDAVCDYNVFSRGQE